MDTLFDRLRKELKISGFAPISPPSKDRPDLVFIIGNTGIKRIVVVELKAANEPLSSEHLDQLMDYMYRVNGVLQSWGETGFRVEGELIGSINTNTNARGVTALLRRIAERGLSAEWRVPDIMEVLRESQDVHAPVLASEKSS